ncbi:hypothetical protein EGW08_022616, partial [Elysia chlorotica]
NFYRLNKFIFTVLAKLAGFALYMIYFTFALSHETGNEQANCLIVGTLIGSVIFAINFIPPTYKKKFERAEIGKKISLVLNNIICLTIVIIGCIAIVAINLNSYKKLRGLIGIVSFILISVFFSVKVSKIKWKQIVWSLIFQFVLYVVMLRIEFGRQIFELISDGMVDFLNHANAGSEFVFGEKYTNHPFALQVLPMILFVSVVFSILYAVNVMQPFVIFFGHIFSIFFNTTLYESMCIVSNIFLGMSEAPLIVKPYLEFMTDSELNLIFTAGFATVSGSIMGAYIMYGASPAHLLSASVMSVFGAITISKILYPEISNFDEQQQDEQNDEQHDDSNVRNDNNASIKSETRTKSVLEAITDGASTAMKIMTGIVANLLAFIPLLALLNTILTWFGERVGVANFTVQTICYYIFWPISYIIGVEQLECGIVGELIGVKIFLNELVAYQELSVYGILSERSIVIATYALCGFSNISAIGIQMATFNVLIPGRKIKNLIVRSMIAGNLVCFLTACIAGI